MKPIKLEFSGLNSYTEKTVIEFEDLIKNKVFGIFGDTGSGKSTILDAISIALYGEIPRNTQNYININCDKVSVMYEFEIKSKQSKKVYKISRTIIRCEDGVRNFKAMLLESRDNINYEVIGNTPKDTNKKIIEILGLTFEDFTKAILLPQGKFNEFIKSTESSKRDILERVFNLEKYGKNLTDKILDKEKEQIKIKKDLEEKLSNYNGISMEVYKNEHKDCHTLRYSLKRKIVELELAQNKYNESKDIYENQLELEVYEKRKKDLELNYDLINVKRKQLENFINAQQVNPYIDRVSILEKKISEDSYKMSNLERKVDILNQELVITRNKYEKSYKKKCELIPQLSTNKIKIQIARELEKEIELLDKELKNLKSNNNYLVSEKNNIEKLKVELESNKDIVIKSLKELEVKINKLKISSDLKRKIFKAYNYEKKYNDLLEKYNLKESKLKDLSKKLDEYNLKLKYLQNDKNILDSKLKNEQIHYEGILNKCPGKLSDVFIKNNYLLDLNLKLSLQKENENKKEDLQVKLNKIIENKHTLEREISVLNDKLETLHKNIGYNVSEINRLKYLNLAQELRKELKENMPCPVCGSRHHEYENSTNTNETIDFIQQKIQKLQEDKNDINHKLEDLTSKYIEQTCLENLNTKEFETIKLHVGEIKSSDLLKKLDEEYRKIEMLKNNIESWQKEKEKSEETISKLKDDKYLIENKEIEINQNIFFYKQYIKETKEELDTLELELKSTKDNYMGLKLVLKIQDLHTKVDEIKNNEKLIENLNEEYVEISAEKINLEKNIKEYDDDLNYLKIELTKNNESYSEKKKSRDEKYREIVSITKGESTLVMLTNIDEEINNIIYQEEKNKKILEEQKYEQEKMSSEKANLEGGLNIEKEEYENQLDQLNQLLRENKFESIYEVKKSILDVDYIRKIHDEIVHYDDELKVVSTKCKELKDNLCGRRITIEKFNSLKENINIIQDDIIKIEEKINLKNNKIIELSNSLDIVDELNNSLENVNKEINLLKELSCIVKDKQLVEYISTGKLIEICEDASHRLFTITNGRYNLKIDDKLNFVVKDNFNDGKIRTIDTLSGGELFLTSLSIAISFSSQIQLKGNIMLDVLFLDEGFGSLDSNMLKQVINSLNNINTKNLSIGVISHVRELKDNIPVKLIVNKNSEKNGSEIRLEYN